jgi:hypothetical protein
MDPQLRSAIGVACHLFCRDSPTLDPHDLLKNRSLAGLLCLQSRFLGQACPENNLIVNTKKNICVTLKFPNKTRMTVLRAALTFHGGFKGFKRWNRHAINPSGNRPKDAIDVFVCMPCRQPSVQNLAQISHKDGYVINIGLKTLDTVNA